MSKINQCQKPDQGSVKNKQNHKQNLSVKIIENKTEIKMSKSKQSHQSVTKKQQRHNTTKIKHNKIIS